MNLSDVADLEKPTETEFTDCTDSAGNPGPAVNHFSGHKSRVNNEFKQLPNLDQAHIGF